MTEPDKFILKVECSYCGRFEPFLECFDDPKGAICPKCFDEKDRAEGLRKPGS